MADLYCFILPFPTPLPSKKIQSPLQSSLEVIFRYQSLKVQDQKALVLPVHTNNNKSTVSGFLEFILHMIGM